MIFISKNSARNYWFNISIRTEYSLKELHNDCYVIDSDTSRVTYNFLEHLYTNYFQVNIAIGR